jgi:undecaprenyl pyrophosphate synthase
LFLEKFWPEMTKDDVTVILEEYNNRHRRFGG